MTFYAYIKNDLQKPSLGYFGMGEPSEVLDYINSIYIEWFEKYGINQIDRLKKLEDHIYDRPDCIKK